MVESLCELWSMLPFEGDGAFCFAAAGELSLWLCLSFMA
jgi:hypothetical protein